MEHRANTNNLEFKKNGQYRIIQSPKDGLWYVIGYCGDGYWMPISDGYKSSTEAYNRMRMQPKIDNDAMRITNEI